MCPGHEVQSLLKKAKHDKPGSIIWHAGAEKAGQGLHGFQYVAPPGAWANGFPAKNARTENENRVEQAHHRKTRQNDKPH